MYFSNNSLTLNVVRLLGFFVLVALMALRIADPQQLRDMRFGAFDTYQQLKPRKYTPQPVSIVDLDERSLREIGQWPWPRTTIGKLVDKLTENGAATIAFDIVFAEEDRLSPEQVAKDNQGLSEPISNALNSLPTNDSILAQAIQNSRVVLGQTSVRGEFDRSNEVRELKDAPYSKLGEDPSQYLVRFPDLVENRRVLENAAKGRGLFSIEEDPDGIVRRIPLIALVSGKMRASLNFEALRVATSNDNFVVKTSEHGIEGVIAAGRLVRTDPNGKVWPYFTVPDRRRYIPAASVLDGTADASRIANHIILIGSSSVGLEDYRPIPLGMRVPGVEIHSQVIENMMTDTLLHRSPRAPFYELLTVGFFGLVIIFFAYRTGAAVAAATVIALSAIILAISWWSFSSYRALLDPTWPILTIFSVSLLGGIANYIREERQRSQIESAFGQYLSPAVVDQLSENPEQLVLGGESRELSVLFTDVRGFTTISESYSSNPQGLTQLMNEFLTALSDPILQNDGTIDKYMGDAIMAFWNAPIKVDNHPEMACRAALAMISAANELNKERAEKKPESHQELRIGIGINTGECIVGNMGSTSRFDYTALGDTVNLASRLEGQSKTYGLDIVVGEATSNSVRDQLATFEIDLIRVKGKNKPARIYCLTGDETLAQSDDFIAFRALNKTMISSYRTQQWDQAFQALEQMEALGEKLKLPIHEYVFIYETRIAEFRANPPGKSWDGVYTASSK